VLVFVVRLGSLVSVFFGSVIFFVGCFGVFLLFLWFWCWFVLLGVFLIFYFGVVLGGF